MTAYKPHNLHDQHVADYSRLQIELGLTEDVFCGFIQPQLPLYVLDMWKGGKPLSVEEVEKIEQCLTMMYLQEIGHAFRTADTSKLVEPSEPVEEVRRMRGRPCGTGKHQIAGRNIGPGVREIQVANNLESRKEAHAKYWKARKCTRHSIEGFRNLIKPPLSQAVHDRWLNGDDLTSRDLGLVSRCLKILLEREYARRNPGEAAPGKKDHPPKNFDEVPSTPKYEVVKVNDEHHTVSSGSSAADVLAAILENVKSLHADLSRLASAENCSEYQKAADWLRDACDVHRTHPFDPDYRHRTFRLLREGGFTPQ